MSFLHFFFFFFLKDLSHVGFLMKMVNNSSEQTHKVGNRWEKLFRDINKYMERRSVLTVLWDAARFSQSVPAADISANYSQILLFPWWGTPWLWVCDFGSSSWKMLTRNKQIPTHTKEMEHSPPLTPMWSIKHFVNFFFFFFPSNIFFFSGSLGFLYSKCVQPVGAPGVHWE